MKEGFVESNNLIGTFSPNKSTNISRFLECLKTQQKLVRVPADVVQHSAGSASAAKPKNIIKILDFDFCFISRIIKDIYFNIRDEETQPLKWGMDIWAWYKSGPPLVDAGPDANLVTGLFNRNIFYLLIQLILEKSLDGFVRFIENNE